MNHDRCEELLAVYRDLQGRERQAVDAHVRACPACAATLLAYRAMDQALGSLEDPLPSPRLRERYYAATARRPRRALWRTLGDAAGWAAVAGVATVLILGLAISARPLAERAWGLGHRAGAPPAPATTAPTPQRMRPATPGPTVADILANPPAPGESVELDAYVAFGTGLVRSGPRPPDDQVVCPSAWASALTDRPFQAVLSLLNGSSSNDLPEDGAWLVAVTPEMAEPGVRRHPDLPYHARLRGHLADPAFAHCPDAARIFMVEEVVQVYEQEPPAWPGWQLPEGYAAWPRHSEASLGYSAPYPPGWRVERLDGASIALRAPDWPGYPVTIRVHEGETHYDQYDPAATPPFLQGESWGVYSQGAAFAQPAEGSQGLAGYRVDRRESHRERTVSVLFSAHGRTYELGLRYPTGLDSPQPLLTAYTAIVEGFRLDVAPGPTPTPPVRQSLGAGPFLSQEEALASLCEAEGLELELLSARLAPEVEARRWAGPCATFAGHPEGVWLLTVRGQFEGQARTILFFLDATSGARLCGEEVSPGVEGEFSIRFGSEPGGEVALSADDLVAYDPATHELALTPAAAERLAGLRPPTTGLPFVVCVGSWPIYQGAFWPGYSSLSYNGVVIDPILAGRGTVRIELGYPAEGLFEGEDPRADPRILQALERAGKSKRGEVAHPPPVG